MGSVRHSHQQLAPARAAPCVRTPPAYGTRRSTPAWSALWQTAVPVVLGVAVAVTGRLTLGWLMLRMAGESATDRLVFLPLAGVDAAAVMAVTLPSMPALWRSTRAEGLRTEQTVTPLAEREPPAPPQGPPADP
ncbi:hypothetical protein [Streptomyces alfalfae]|uniref:hypothetical protein n=1 Tax=Streptomyces alfalfae TaxID=1642299 RepID=UPI000F4F138B|nr:hypothetical protein [Streptomyces alfalfae]QUI29810.1 hypothetical protein H9W91_02255 [Streptomyces alfalfae]